MTEEDPDRPDLRAKHVGGNGRRVLDEELQEKQKVLLPFPVTKLRAMSVPNFSRVLSAKPRVNTDYALQRKASKRQSAIDLLNTPDVRRWDPQLRTSSPWDGLRRDEELWSQTGDCAVHLYGKGKSRRRPSFMIPFDDLEAAACVQMISNYSAPDEVQDLPNSMGVTRSSLDMNSVSTASTRHSTLPTTKTTTDMFISAPEDSMRSDAFQWHLATRNFFAWVMNKPLVGVNLGDTLIALLERMNLFRAQADNISDLLSYAERLGYMDFVECPDYALAFLRFAEQYQLRNLWLDAFTHCVGMNEAIKMSTEYEATSRVTKALITRAYLEMDLHLGRVSRALRTFLEDELSPGHFGLSAGAQAHLDRFRSFLNSYYVNQFGYWPPEKGPIFSKALIKHMYSDFHNLYEYLVDNESSYVMQDQLAKGGICVLQNVNAFNARHNYEPLPHPLPLVPEFSQFVRRTDSQRGLKSFKLGAKPSKFELGMTARSAMAMATNSVGSEVQDSSLVKEYVHFEREWSAQPGEKVSVADARKVRWIAIYCILQMLHSVTRNPSEVRDPHSTSYHICLLTIGAPPWGPGTNEKTASGNPSGPKIGHRRQAGSLVSFIADKGAISLGIEPDFSVKDDMPERSPSGALLRPAPLRISTCFSTKDSPPASKRSSVLSINDSMIPSRQSSLGKSSLATSATKDTEATMSDDGNGLCSTAIRRPSRDSPVGEDASVKPDHVLRPLEPYQVGNPFLEPARTPTFDERMLDASTVPDSPIGAYSPSSVYSQCSAYSPISTASSRLSTMSVPPSASTASWNLDDADRSDTFSLPDGDGRRSSRGIYSMEHDSVASSPDRHSPAASAGSPHRSDSGFFSHIVHQKKKSAWTTAGIRNSIGAISFPRDWATTQSTPAPAAKARRSCEERRRRTRRREGDDDGATSPLRVDVRFDIHRALDMLPQHIPAQRA